MTPYRKSYQYIGANKLEGPVKEVINYLNKVTMEAEALGWTDLYLDINLEIKDSKPYYGHVRAVPVCYFELIGVPPKQ